MKRRGASKYGWLLSFYRWTVALFVSGIGPVLICFGFLCAHWWNRVLFSSSISMSLECGNSHACCGNRAQHRVALSGPRQLCYRRLPRFGHLCCSGGPEQHRVLFIDTRARPIHDYRVWRLVHYEVVGSGWVVSVAQPLPTDARCWAKCSCVNYKSCLVARGCGAKLFDAACMICT